MKRITILRHGSTELNEQDCSRGWLNVPLSDKGRQEAKIAAEFLAPREFSAIYASDLGRAVETANIVAEYHPNLMVEWTACLRPINFGDWQGQPIAKVGPLMDELSERWATDLSIESPNGESFKSFQDRAYPFLLSLPDNALVVTHTRTASYAIAMMALNNWKMLFPDDISKMKRAEVSCANIAVVCDNEIAELNPIPHKEEQWTTLS